MAIIRDGQERMDAPRSKASQHGRSAQQGKPASWNKEAADTCQEICSKLTNQNARQTR